MINHSGFFSVLYLPFLDKANEKIAQRASHDLVVATLDTCFMERRLLHIIHGIHIGFVFDQCLSLGARMNYGICGYPIEFRQSHMRIFGQKPLEFLTMY